MRSRAHFKTHPIHPILIVFPTAFFTGTLIFDFLHLVTGNPDYWQTGGMLAVAGIIGGLMAAVPGAIDYFLTVPPHSTAKKRASRHGLLNILNMGIFIAAVILRRDDQLARLWLVIMEAAGVAIMMAAGWMGGTLVHRNQIGVDHRYANAGKWNEETLEEREGEIPVATSREIKRNAMKLVHIGKRRIVIGNTGQGYVAFSDHCTHRGGSLAGGALCNGIVQCPWHGSQFDVHTGEVMEGPAGRGIEIYPVSEHNGKIYISL